MSRPRASHHGAAPLKNQEPFNEAGGQGHDGSSGSPTVRVLLRGASPHPVGIYRYIEPSSLAVLSQFPRAEALVGRLGPPVVGSLSRRLPRAEGGRGRPPRPGPLA
jgi:hypothetical protein